MTRVLVTGATGFVGRHLLGLPRSWSIRAAVRRSTNIEFDGVEFVTVGDINRDTDWATALRGVDCVVHMAARVHVMSQAENEQELFDEINVHGTAHLALMAAAASVKRFIFLSSIKVNGETTCDRPFSSFDEPAPVDAYGKSKWLAEQQLVEISGRTGMEVIAIRPPLVYGPGVRANFERLLLWVQRGFPLPLGSVQNARSLVNVWNLCDLIDHLVRLPTISPRVVMVSDGVDLSTPNLIRALAASMGKPSRLFPMPVKLLKVLALAAGHQAQIERLCSSLTLDIGETRKLSWQAPVSLHEGIDRTVAWYLKR